MPKKLAELAIRDHTTKVLNEHRKGKEKNDPHIQHMENHLNALMMPKEGFEFFFTDTIRALGRYADAHAKRYESDIADDYLIGGHFRDIAERLMRMRDGEMGRLDAQLTGELINEVLERAGFDKTELF